MSTKHSITHLKLTIWNDFISPSLEEDRIKREAQQLGFGQSLTISQATKLHNVIVTKLINQIETFMNSADARTICKEVSLFNARASFSDLISENLDPRIQSIFSLTQPPPAHKNLSLWERVLTSIGGVAI